jgi:hypothetical protein
VAIAIVLVIVLVLMILWQRRRLLSAGRDFGAKDFQSDYERPDADADGAGADDPSRR